MAFGNDVNTMTPGSAVADSLEDILTRKRNEARQAMLDSITQKSAQARDDYMRENSASLAQQRAAKSQELTELANQKYLTGLGSSARTVDPATAAKLQAIAPDRLQTSGGATLPSTATTGVGSTLPTGTPPSISGPQVGPTQPQPSPLPVQKTNVPSVQDASVPTTNQYLGSPEYQHGLQTQAKLTSLADELEPGDPHGKLHAVLRVAALYPQVDPTKAVESAITSKPMVPAMRMNRVTGKIDSALGPDNKPIMAPAGSSEARWEWGERPTPVPAADTPFMSGTVPDPNNPGQRIPAQVKILPGMVDKATGRVNYQGGFIPDGKLGPARPAKPVPDDDYDRKTFTEFTNAFKNKKADAGAVISLRSAFVSKIKNKTIRQDVTDALDYADQAARSSKTVPTIEQMEQSGMISAPPSITDPDQVSDYMNNLKAKLKMAGLK